MEPEDTLLKLTINAANLDTVEKMLKEKGIKLKKINSWVPKYIIIEAYHKMTDTAMIDMFNIASGTLYKYAKDVEEVKDIIKTLKDEKFAEYEEKMSLLVNKSITALDDLIDSADTDSTRLKAAELILKKYNLISDKQNIELNGKLDIPSLIIRPLVSEDGDVE